MCSMTKCGAVTSAGYSDSMLVVRCSVVLPQSCWFLRKSVVPSIFLYRAANVGASIFSHTILGGGGRVLIIIIVYYHFSIVSPSKPDSKSLDPYITSVGCSSIAETPNSKTPRLPPLQQHKSK